MTASKDAFVIMPFDEEFEDLYEDKIEPTLADHGYEVNKADSLETQRNIIQDIVNGIEDADLIIADLTGTNPNVFYELGIAHGLGIPTVLIAQDIDELPFDLEAYKTIEYSLKYDEIKKFEEELSDISSSHSEGEIEFGNPVSDYTDVDIAQSSVDAPNGGDSSVSPADSDSEEETSDSDDTDLKKSDPEKGLIEYMTEIEQYQQQLDDLMVDISEESKSLEGELYNHVGRIESIASMDNATNRKKVNNVARDIADILSEYSEFLEQKIEPFENNLQFFLDAMQSLIEYADASKQEEEELLIDVREEIDKFINESQRSLKDIHEFESQLEEIRGLHRELDKSINNLKSNMEELKGVLQEGAAKGERFDSLIKNKLDDV
jgi:nucleoside 2-deoxyribosyltransferase